MYFLFPKGVFSTPILSLEVLAHYWTFRYLRSFRVGRLFGEYDFATAALAFWWVESFRSTKRTGITSNTYEKSLSLPLPVSSLRYSPFFGQKN